MVAESIAHPSGMSAVNLQVAEKYVEAFAQIAKTNNTMLLPANFSDMGSMIATAMSIVKGTQAQK